MQTIKVQNPHGFNIIIGHIPNRQTVDSINYALRNNLPEVKFGIAFSQIDPTQIAYVGSDKALTELAKTNARKVGVEQTFFLFTENEDVRDVMKVLKTVPEIDRIYCATQNQVEVIVVGQHKKDIMGLVGDYSNLAQPASN